MENVLITGTTSGFGKAFAEKFASMGYNIILVSRDMQKLKQQQLYLQYQYHVTVNFIAYDLTKEDAADFIIEQIDNWNIPIDFLVNNAGFNEFGLFSQTDISKEIKMIDLHIRFITQLTKHILSIMEKNNYGHILNIGSTGSFIPSPSDAVYSATKAYITLLCPGATETEFARKANIEQTLLFKYAVMKPDKVIKIAYPKIIKGKRLIIPGIYNKFLVFFSKIMPIDITNKLTMIMMNSH